MDPGLDPGFQGSRVRSRVLPIELTWPLQQGFCNAILSYLGSLARCLYKPGQDGPASGAPYHSVYQCTGGRCSRSRYECGGRTRQTRWPRLNADSGGTVRRGRGSQHLLHHSWVTCRRNEGGESIWSYDPCTEWEFTFHNDLQLPKCVTLRYIKILLDCLRSVWRSSFSFCPTQEQGTRRLKVGWRGTFSLADQNQHIPKPTWVKLQCNGHSRSVLKSVLKMAKLAPYKNILKKAEPNRPFIWRIISKLDD